MYCYFSQKILNPSYIFQKLKKVGSTDCIYIFYFIAHIYTMHLHKGTYFACILQMPLISYTYLYLDHLKSSTMLLLFVELFLNFFSTNVVKKYLKILLVRSSMCLPSNSRKYFRISCKWYILMRFTWHVLY